MKKKALLFAFSFSIMLAWAFAFIDISADGITAFLGFTYTFVGIYLLRKQYNYKFSLTDNLIIISFPFFYFLVFTYLYGTFSFRYIYCPLIPALVVLFSSVTIFKDLSKPLSTFILIFFTLFYSYAFFPTWREILFHRQIENFDTDPKPKPSKKKEVVLNDTINLFDFAFINPNLDTLTIPKNKDFILLESWNETCPPCMKAFRDMPPFYKSQEDKMAVFYLYEHRKASVRKKFDKIFNFKPLQKEQSKILIDIDQNLYKTMNIRSYPYFLLFDKTGKLVFYQAGYHSDYREKLEEKILAVIEG